MSYRTLKIIISYAISLSNSKFLELTVKERLDVVVRWENQYKTSIYVNNSTSKGSSVFPMDPIAT